MISSEIRVNKLLIGHIYCTNVSKKKDKSVYEVTFYNVRVRKATSFTVKHSQKDGFEKLMFLIWKQINKNLCNSL